MRALIPLLFAGLLAAAGAALWLGRPAARPPELEPPPAARAVETPAAASELAAPEVVPAQEREALGAADVARPAPVAGESAEEREKHLQTLQRLRGEFERGLERQGKQRFFVAQNLDVYSIIVLLDADHRGRCVRGQTRVSLTPSHPGELRIGGGEYLYVFESHEFPHYEQLLDLAGRAFESSEEGAESLELPAEVQASVVARADAALAVLTRDG